MKSELKKLQKSQVEITVELSIEEMQPYLVKAAENIAKEIKVEGFRPGKAPYDIVKAKVGEMGIWQEAIDDVISKTYYEVLKEHKIVAIGQPKIDIEKLAPNNPFVYKAVADVLPEVKIGDWQKIKIKKEKVTVKDEQLEQVLADIRKMRSTEKLVDRVAKKDDKLEIDFEIFQDNVPIENGAHKKYPIVIGENRFIPGFEDQLIGLKAGEAKEFELKFPGEYHAKNLAGKKCLFKVVCNGVYEITLPELNDEFAGQISGGKFKTLAEVKDSIKTNLTDEENAKQDQRLEVEMFEKLVAVSEFEPLPDTLVDYEVSKMLNELQHSIGHQGFNYEDYLASIKKTEDDLKIEFRPQAEKRVKASILSREIYHQQKFEVRDDEVDKEIEEMLKHYPANPEVKKQFESETYKDYLRNIIGNKKVVEFLKKEIISE